VVTSEVCELDYKYRQGCRVLIFLWDFDSDSDSDSRLKSAIDSKLVSVYTEQTMQRDKFSRFKKIIWDYYF